ncbi:Cytochrome c-type protein NapC [Paramagnetospirillum magnetotacticum MS-1]|uniref:Cytochrome c-type protein NapC n=1 Tax=Paramagnetospirillum magnetotacticum MS-1 TaxID=272627 RepID=A0A0C2YPH5_PARME|nr:ethylbenzene dehydrogenase-related protein [Paramagnetospirillum magnetotacticum]KIL97038.1 Cytochrome c-type protein NapC [Paramagnetospirillum magnetotacticum MS-1]
MNRTALTALMVLASTPAFALDWSDVPAKEVVLFYPGQSSLEWVLSGDHGGAPKVKNGKACKECHLGEEKDMGATLVSGAKNEPAPMAGKPAFIPATVRVAQENGRLLVRLEFKEGAQPDSKMDPDFATKVTMMLDDGTLPEATQAGCWGTCHEDAAKMPAGGTGERTKYLNRSRAKPSRQGAGDELVAAAELEKMRASGQVMEFWQARLKPGMAAVAASGTIFDKRMETKPSAVTAEASSNGDAWTVTLSRPLSAPAPYKSIETGKTYTVGFAIHAGHTARRFHYVSLEHSLALDKGDADLIAVKK